MAVPSPQPSDCIPALTAVIARGTSPDPSGAAESLIHTLGSVASVLSSSVGRLARACGDESAAIEVVRFAATMRRVMRAQVSAGPVVPSSAALLDYLHADMAGARSERVRVLFLDARNVLLADEVLFSGTLDATTFSPREIVARALELNAAAVIVAHNHPSGDPSPSEADRRHTGRLVAAASLFGITVLDHVVIASGGVASLMAVGPA